ncbi:MAG: hypothetical protein R2856_35785 [Caldilineaceae bacterium]
MQWVRRQPTLTQLEPWIEKSFDLLDQLDSPLELADLCRRLGWHAFNLHPHPWQEHGNALSSTWNRRFRCTVCWAVTTRRWRPCWIRPSSRCGHLNRQRAEDILHEAEMRSDQATAAASSAVLPRPRDDGLFSAAI